MSYLVATFYKFVTLADLETKRLAWQAFCREWGIKGTILLATEGINGTVAGSPDAIAVLLEKLRREPGLEDLSVRESLAETPPFQRMKIKVKSEIVTLGRPDINPNDQVGQYVSPQQWNQLLQDPEVIVIDTRNQYEVDIGTFQGATNPQTHHFREFPQYVSENLDPNQTRKVAMFCTGGIRCEKASAFMLRQGFSEVYHLQGGILNYLATVPPQESLWQGECFVFDQRIALQAGLTEGHYAMCAACGHPLSEAETQSSQYESGIVCPHCWENQTPEKRAKQERRRLNLGQKALKLSPAKPTNHLST